MKTEYRIIPHRTFIADKYLQFKSYKYVRSFWKFWEKPKRVECWRFIPKDTYAYVLGVCLNEHSCPESTGFFGDAHFLHCFNEQEWDLVGFSKNYEDISKYFEKLQDKRREHLEDEEKKKNMKVQYL